MANLSTAIDHCGMGLNLTSAWRVASRGIDHRIGDAE